MGKTIRSYTGQRPRPSQGKGDAPRNMGPKFRDNYDGINWRRKDEKKPRNDKETDQ